MLIKLSTLQIISILEKYTVNIKNVLVLNPLNPKVIKYIISEILTESLRCVVLKNCPKESL